MRHRSTHPTPSLARRPETTPDFSQAIRVTVWAADGESVCFDRLYTEAPSHEQVDEIAGAMFAALAAGAAR